MELQNEFTVPAPVSEVWKTLLDVERIAPCLPGATVDRHEGDEVAGRVNVKVGPITASYAGTARFVTKDESEHRFVLQARGRETRGSGSAAATVSKRTRRGGRPGTGTSPRPSRRAGRTTGGPACRDPDAAGAGEPRHHEHCRRAVGQAVRSGAGRPDARGRPWPSPGSPAPTRDRGRSHADASRAARASSPRDRQLSRTRRRL